MDWTEVVWTEAWQVTGLQGWPRRHGDEASPAHFFQALRDAGEDVDAVRFLASALPRFRSVEWLRAVIARLAPDADAPTLALIDAWLREPTDRTRRDAFETSLPLAAEDPAKICAAALLFSGGSLAPLAAPSIPPPKTGTGQLVAGGVLHCAYATATPDVALSVALDLGVSIAVKPVDKP
ncbi:DUF6931 family protein [Sphingomonas arantia]|uniref:DUF6931 family protein n=1 Tax=Sphingomonas arantia TaxID=1460676 RepID=A0ABW4U0M6_9SPHN